MYISALYAASLILDVLVYDIKMQTIIIVYGFRTRIIIAQVYIVQQMFDVIRGVYLKMFVLQTLFVCHACYTSCYMRWPLSHFCHYASLAVQRV